MPEQSVKTYRAGEVVVAKSAVNKADNNRKDDKGFAVAEVRNKPVGNRPRAKP